MTHESRNPDQDPSSVKEGIGHSGSHGEKPAYEFTLPDGTSISLEEAIDRGLVHGVSRGDTASDVLVSVPSDLGEHRDPTKTPPTSVHAPFTETTLSTAPETKSKRKPLIIGAGSLAALIAAGSLAFGMRGDNSTDPDNARNDRRSPVSGSVSPTPPEQTSPTETFPPLDASIIPLEPISIGGEQGRNQLYEAVKTPFEREKIDVLVNDELRNQLKVASDGAKTALDTIYPLDPSEIYTRTSLLESQIYSTNELDPWRARGVADTFVKPIDFPTTADLSGNVTGLARKLLTIPDAFNGSGMALYADAYVNKAPDHEREFALRMTNVGKAPNPDYENEAVVYTTFQAAEADGSLEQIVAQTKIYAKEKLDISNAEIIQVSENPFNNSGFIKEGDPTLLQVSFWIQTKSDIDTELPDFDGRIVTMQLTSAPVKGGGFQGYIINETYVSTSQGT